MIKQFLISVVLIGLANSAVAQSLFPELNPQYPTTDLLLPEGYSYKILFSESTDSVRVGDGRKAPSKGRHDLLTLLPIDNDYGLIYVGHEDRVYDRLIGDGGGGTVFHVKRESGEWYQSSEFKAIDFSPVGGTINNCGGSLTPMGKILTAEEWDLDGNEKLNNNGQWISDTSDYNGKAKWKNFGWMVQVDPVTRKAEQKLYQMGRFAHEDAIVMPDNRTVYLTDDNSPAVWFKFIALRQGDFSTGQLYAYSEKAVDESNWLAMPMDYESMLNARDVAISLGATLFNRMEWVEGVGNKLYISETGKDQTQWKKYIDRGGIPASHLDGFASGSVGVYSDPYGRILKFDTATDKMSVHLEGGICKNKKFAFTNPDGLTQVSWNNKTYLVIHEDILGTSLGRSGSQASNTKEVYNEIYLLDLDIESPEIEHLQRLCVAPRGCETTGGYFSPDGSSMFLNIQEPDRTNPEPFNRSHTIVITGFEKIIQ